CLGAEVDTMKVRQMGKINAGTDGRSGPIDDRRGLIVCQRVGVKGNAALTRVDRLKIPMKAEGMKPGPDRRRPSIAGPYASDLETCLKVRRYLQVHLIAPDERLGIQSAGWRAIERGKGRVRPSHEMMASQLAQKESVVDLAKISERSWQLPWLVMLDEQDDGSFCIVGQN